MTIDNNGPKDANEYEAGLNALQADLDRFDGVEINEQLAAELNDFMAVARNTNKEAEKDRKLIKEPFLQGGRDVDARFKPVTTRLSEMLAKAKSILTPYVVEQQRIAEEIKRKAREEAEAKARAAELLAEDEIVGEMVKQEAEDSAKIASIADAQAENAGRVGSASGYARTASVRSYWDASISDARAAAIHYCDHPKVQDVIIALAQADMRGDKSKSIKITGIQFTERKEVA